jgi:DNA-binding NarL/FixJ family response regulator
MPVTTVLIVEDHPIFSKGLAQLIGAQPGFTVVGEARNGAEALSLLVAKEPSLVILDLNLGDEDGLSLIKDIKSRAPDAVILVLSMHDERYYAERAIRSGAAGYIMKEAAGTKVLDAIRTVVSGGVWLSDAERSRLEGYAASPDAATPDADWLASISKLSDRQLQIFSLIGKGLGTVEIAAKLDLSTKTIDTHKEHIKAKLHCGSTQELRQLAVEWTSRQQ